VLNWPALDSTLTALNIAFFPQLALTLTNALFLTAVIAHEYYPDDKTRITEDRLAVTTGGLNLLLAPFGAIPMCHGASGLVAYHAAGGRSGLPVIVLGLVLLLLGLMTGPAASYYLSLLPKPVFGILLLVTATYMVAPKKLLKISPISMLTVLLVTVIGVVYSLLVGLLAGMLFEYITNQVIKLRKHAGSESL
jgi:MFS superfamily sulfate permease-like transporter